MKRLDGLVVLVTGAGGFIGPHVVRELLELGARVRAITAPAGAPSARLPDDVEVLTLDVTDRDATATIARGVDRVIHLAGAASVRRSLASPMEAFDAHLGGTLNMLEACRHDVDTFVYFSSAEVYGRPRNNPVPEDEPLAPLTPYGAAKAAAESAVRAFASTYGFAGVVMRPFSVYGPGMIADSVVNFVVRQAQTSKRIIVADARPVRDFVYVGDVANVAGIACAFTTPGCTVVNVGTGVGTSVGELARAAAALVEPPLPVEEDVAARRPAAVEVDELVASVKAASEVLGWNAATQLHDGLVSTLGWARTTAALTPS